MKVNKEILIPSINIILLITLIALASSCTTQEKMVGNYYNHTKFEAMNNINKNYTYDLEKYSLSGQQ